MLQSHWGVRQMSDKVRVLRLIEYSGPRDKVERQLEGSMKDGTHHKGAWPGANGFNQGVTIKIATLGDFPEVLERSPLLSGAEAKEFIREFKAEFKAEVTRPTTDPLDMPEPIPPDILADAHQGD